MVLSFIPNSEFRLPPDPRHLIRHPELMFTIAVMGILFVFDSCFENSGNVIVTATCTQGPLDIHLTVG